MEIFYLERYDGSFIDIYPLNLCDDLWNFNRKFKFFWSP